MRHRRTARKSMEPERDAGGQKGGDGRHAPPVPARSEAGYCGTICQDRSATVAGVRNIPDDCIVPFISQT